MNFVSKTDSLGGKYPLYPLSSIRQTIVFSLRSSWVIKPVSAWSRGRSKSSFHKIPTNLYPRNREHQLSWLDTWWCYYCWGWSGRGWYQWYNKQVHRRRRMVEKGGDGLLNWFRCQTIESVLDMWDRWHLARRSSVDISASSPTLSGHSKDQTSIGSSFRVIGPLDSRGN